MEVSCPACSTRYLVNDERVRGKTARMRCKSCQTVWMVSGPMGGADLSTTAGGRAAIIRRGAEREKRDLFATQPPDHGSVKQTMRPPAPNYGFSTAGRNENSVLFTVDELKRAAGARVQTPEPIQVAPSAPQDDSGVIDLKALSQAPPPAAGPLVPPMLFSEPPPGAFAVDATGPATAQTASKAWIAWTGAAAAAILMLGVGVAALAFRGEEPVNRLAAAPPPPAVTTTPAAPEPAPAAAASDDAKSPSVSAADEGATASKGKAGKKGKWSRGAGKGAKASRRTTTTAKPAAPAKAADPCHCKGDFTCILRCTAKGK